MGVRSKSHVDIVTVLYSRLLCREGMERTDAPKYRGYHAERYERYAALFTDVYLISRNDVYIIINEENNFTEVSM